MTGDVVLSITYGLSCLIGGYMLGRLERLQGDKERRDRIANVLRLVVALLVIALAVFTVYKREQQSNCYERYFTGVSQALAERSDSSGREITAQLAFLRSFDDPNAADPTGADARRAYIASVEELERERIAAPIPQPPNCR